MSEKPKQKIINKQTIEAFTKIAAEMERIHPKARKRIIRALVELYR